MYWLDDLVTHASTQLDDRVLDELYTRGVTDDQIKMYQIGYVNKVLPPADYPIEFLKWCWEGARLKDMYVFPLTSPLGDVRGVQFRHVSRDEKGYLDYSEDRGEAVLLGLGQAMPHIWRTGEILLVEGGFDLYPIQRFVPQTVATITAKVSGAFLRVLRRLVKTIWLAYDKDPPGRKAAARFMKEHGDEFHIVDVDYPCPIMPNGKHSKDPSELWEMWGDTRLGPYLQGVLANQP